MIVSEAMRCLSGFSRNSRNRKSFLDAKKESTFLLFQLQSEIIMIPENPDMLRPFLREPLPERFCNFDRLLKMLELWNLYGL